MSQVPIFLTQVQIHVYKKTGNKNTEIPSVITEMINADVSASSCRGTNSPDSYRGNTNGLITVSKHGWLFQECCLLLSQRFHWLVSIGKSNKDA
jgi:hypothetical protein